jgi:DNA replication protein DnaC
MEKSTDPNQRECDILNATPGDLPDFDCPDCLNRGVIYRVDGNYIVSRECHCMETRRSMWNIKKSGIASLLKQCTFENFRVESEWQKDLISGAKSFLTDHDGKWFYVGGQVGCGKTHTCTAMCGEFLKQGFAVRYMLWRDEVVKLKAVVNDDVEYPKLINPLKTAPVLYVDDFFKTGDELDRLGKTVKKKPTQADINVAFEIFNYRYINPKLITIISSERSINDLLECDEAVGSRIYQRTKDYCYYFRPDKAKNYRLR